MVRRVYVNMTDEEYGLWSEWVRGRGQSITSYIRRLMNDTIGIETKALCKGGRPPWRHNAKSDGTAGAKAAAGQAVSVRIGSEADAPVKVPSVPKARKEAEFFSKDRRPDKPLCHRCARIGVALCEECLK